jgi:hypothetical protein
MRPRNVACRLDAIGAANSIIISVPPAKVNQVFTSMLLTTSPWRSASSRRRGVGSSVRSFVSVLSSAIGLTPVLLPEHDLFGKPGPTFSFAGA